MKIENVKNTLKEFKTIITIILIVLLILIFVRIVKNTNISQIIKDVCGIISKINHIWRILKLIMSFGKLFRNANKKKILRVKTEDKKLNIKLYCISCSFFIRIISFRINSSRLNRSVSKSFLCQCEISCFFWHIGDICMTKFMRAKFSSINNRCAHSVFLNKTFHAPNR